MEETNPYNSIYKEYKNLYTKLKSSGLIGGYTKLKSKQKTIQRKKSSSKHRSHGKLTNNQQKRPFWRKKDSSSSDNGRGPFNKRRYEHEYRHMEEEKALPVTDEDIEKLNQLMGFENIKNMYDDLINPKPELYSYNNIPRVIKYTSGSGILNDNCHFGQRKLLLTEIEYYNMLNHDKQYLVIYPGSASCEHLPVILQLFPNLKFLLIDPNYHSIDNRYQFKYIYQNIDVISKSNVEHFKSQLNPKFKKNNFFKKRDEHLQRNARLLLKVNFLYDTNQYNVYDVLDLESNREDMKKLKEEYTKDSDDLITKIFADSNRVFIIQDYMSIDLSLKIKRAYDKFIESRKPIEDQETVKVKKINMCFLSDIRTSLFRAGSPTDLDIMWNYALQIIFIKILQPKYTMTKFRPPWYSEEDIVGQHITKLFKLYVDGADSKKIHQEIDKIKESDNNSESNSSIVEYQINHSSRKISTYSDATIHFKSGINEDLNLSSDIIELFKIVKKDFDYVKNNYKVDLYGGMLEKKTYYFANDFIYTQAWAPPNSGETRVFVSRKNMDKFITYDHQEWEDKFFYIRYVRLFSYFDQFHKILKEKLPRTEYDYDGCYDCFRELMILGNYLLCKGQKKTRFDGVMDIKKIQKIIEANTSEILDLYRLINRYVYYDLKPSQKCKSHNTQKMTTLSAKFYIVFDPETVYAYNVQIDKKTDKIKKENIIKKSTHHFDSLNEFN
jgi:hypothetical protein